MRADAQPRRPPSSPAGPSSSLSLLPTCPPSGLHLDTSPSSTRLGTGHGLLPWEEVRGLRGTCSPGLRCLGTSEDRRVQVPGWALCPGHTHHYASPGGLACLTRWVELLMGPWSPHTIHFLPLWEQESTWHLGWDPGIRVLACMPEPTPYVWGGCPWGSSESSSPPSLNIPPSILAARHLCCRVPGWVHNSLVSWPLPTSPACMGLPYVGRW